MKFSFYLGIIVFSAVWGLFSCKTTSSLQNIDKNATYVSSADSFFYRINFTEDCRGILEGLDLRSQEYVLDTFSMKKVSDYQISAEGNAVRIKSDKRNLNLDLQVQKPNAISDLDGSWLLVKIDSTTLDKKATLNFNTSENRLSGSFGCNSGGGEFFVSSHILKAATIITTRKACLDMSTENILLRTLSDYCLWSIDGGILTVKSKRHTLVFMKL